jgi:hypothetical protein
MANMQRATRTGLLKPTACMGLANGFVEKEACNNCVFTMHNTLGTPSNGLPTAMEKIVKL